MRFAFYGRVSTEDAQDPAASRAWQLRRSNELIATAGGQVVAEYFDIGQSRSLPWKRRPEASRLLADLADPDRGWGAVVIGEPARAFYGGQFGLTFPLFTHYRVALWVPEVGGAVDPGSEAHDLVMTLFGGLSKGERTRIKVRVRSAMEAMAADGNRFLGGRPPYGYRLADAGPHPNPAKATAGQRLHRLEPDPVTAPVVRRMFELYAEGAGLRLIADTMTGESIPSPAAYDRRRNPHRDPAGWAHTAVRAILTNPIYDGRKVWGKQQRHEDLLDVTDVAAGHVTRMRWQPDSQWITAARNDTEALVDPELAERVSARFGRAPTRTKPRDAQYPYLLRGLLRCRVCGRRMQGQARPARTPSHPTRVLYRCPLRSQRSLPADVDHPAAVYLREDAVVPKLDAWLAEIVTPEALAAAQVRPPEAAAHDAATKAAIADCDLRIDRLMQSVEEAGMPMEWVSRRIVELRNERDRLERTLPDKSRWRPLSAGEIEAMATALGGLMRALQEASPADRAAVYAQLGLQCTYDPALNQVRAEVDLARGPGGVGGGT
jgi:site-specific DNA recombinase